MKKQFFNKIIPAVLIVTGMLLIFAHVYSAVLTN